jgi:hypothetical protein
MVTLAWLATAGLILGMSFNVYALAASCVTVLLLNFASAFDVGISEATLSFALALIFLQIGYFAGLLASGLFIPQRLRRSLHREDDAEKFLKVPGSIKERRERTAPPFASSQGRIQ